VGTLKDVSWSPGLSAVYVSSGAGEYGVSLEERMEMLEFSILEGASVSTGGGGVDETQDLAGRTLRKRLTDTCLLVHATFLQQYENFGVFARIALGRSFKAGRSIGGYGPQSFFPLDPDLLEALRPRQEVRLSVGIRY
jgi:hypothetical protein